MKVNFAKIAAKLQRSFGDRPTSSSKLEVKFWLKNETPIPVEEDFELEDGRDFASYSEEFRRLEGAREALDSVAQLRKIFREKDQTHEDWFTGDKGDGVFANRSVDREEGVQRETTLRLAGNSGLKSTLAVASDSIEESILNFGYSGTSYRRELSYSAESAVYDSDGQVQMLEKVEIEPQEHGYLFRQTMTELSPVSERSNPA